MVAVSTSGWLNSEALRPVSTTAALCCTAPLRVAIDIETISAFVYLSQRAAQRTRSGNTLLHFNFTPSEPRGLPQSTSVCNKRRLTTQTLEYWLQE